MDKFLKYCIFFISPIVLFLITIEIIVGNIPNSYSYKYNYVKTNGDKIQALAIGHSQLYAAFKSEYFYLSSFNLSNYGQGYIDNYYLLCELLPYMPNLKVVIMPIGYMDVRTMGNDTLFTDRTCYYYRYMNLDYDGRIPLRYRIECFDFQKVRSKLFSYYFYHLDIVECDSLGRSNTYYLRGRQRKLNYTKWLEYYTRKENNYQKLCMRDEYYPIKTFKLLMEKNITIVLVSPPYYWNCGFKNVNMTQKKFIENYTVELCKKYPIYYLNLESDTTFIDDDFFDEIHLSEIGAKKFTKKLNDFVREFMGEV